MSTNVKTALVTGGSQRVGAAIVTDLAAHGFNVAIHYDSSADKAETLADTLTKHGTKVVPLRADLTALEPAQCLIERAAETLGPIDLLVNNASIFEPDEATGFNDELWDKHFNIHVKAPSILAAAMFRQKDISSGLIVNIIDERVHRLNPMYYSYTLSKSALWTATQTMAQTFAPRIRVNAIGPGPTLPNKRQNDADFERQVDGLLLKASPGLDEFGNTVRYWYDTPSATGQIIMLDGGQHLAWRTPDLMGRE